MAKADDKANEKKPTDLFARAQEAARRELASLRPAPERAVRDTLLTGHRRFHASLPDF